MEVSGQLHSPSALPLETAGWTPEAGIEPSLPARSLASLPTELSRVFIKKCSKKLSETWNFSFLKFFALKEQANLIIEISL
jgi:hypothetical protein